MLRLFDLPAHPLLVHFPVVAIPALSIIAIVIALRPSFRDRFGVAAIVLGAVTTVATFLAVSSGQALADEFQLDDEFIGTHRQLGETLRFFVLGLTVSLVGLVGAARRPQAGDRDPLSMAMAALGIVLAALSIIWVIRTGHEGAKSVWEGSV